MKRFFSTLCVWAVLAAGVLLAAPLAGVAEAGHLDLDLAGLGIGFAGVLVNQASVSAIFVNLKTTFNKAFDSAPAIWNKIAMRVPSSGSQNDYDWLENFPRMRRWLGDKAVKALAAGAYSLRNENFEATIAVKRDHIEDDNLGIYAPQAQSAGFSAKQWPDELVFEAVNGSFDTKCFDGQYFCDTDHPVFNPETGADESVSNKGTAALSVATQAAAQASYGAALAAMMAYKDNEGRPLNVVPNVLLVPPALRDVGKALLTSERLEDGKINLYRDTAELVVAPWLTSTTAWFLLDTSKPVLPFIFQERKAPVFVQQTREDADDVFMRGEFKFGAEARGASGYGFWQLCYGSTGQG